MRRLVLATVAALSVALAGCGGNGGPSKGSGTSVRGTAGGSSGTPGVPVASSAAAASIVIKPASQAAKVDPASLISVSVTGGTLTSVTAKLSGGAAVDGALDAARTAWTSANPVGVGHTYAVTATALGGDGKQETATSTFTTATPAATFTGTYTPDGGTTVGVAQPVSITFNASIKDRAAVEKQLSVTADPPVSGSWYWFGGRRVDWRPEQYWAPGTKVTLHMRLDGVKSGASYGKQNRDVTFTVGRSLVATMNAETHEMTVVEDGKTTVLPVSSGKPGFETWNGTMVVLEKFQDIEMNSSTVGIFGVNAYDIPDVYWDVRLTPSGTFVHAAPWNAGKFGKVNGSHGCIGMSTADAKWFYGQVIPGDPVTVTHSKDTVKPDNGFGDWNISWADWAAGSALAG